MSRVVVMGLGRFGGGAAVARFYAEGGHDVLVTDRAGEERLAATLEGLRDLELSFRLGSHDEADFDRAEILAVNPAIPFDHPLVERARSGGAAVVTEIGLTLERLPGPVVAVTGTNGKSTTCALAAAMLEASGLPVALGGNIGRSLLNETAGMAPGTVAVLELSSFQLHWLEHDGLAPRVAIITNVSGDHFDRHPDFDHYVASKRRLVESVGPEGLVVLPAADEVARGFARVTRGRVTWFGGSCEEPLDLAGLRLPGSHNRANAAAAAHAALEAGATRQGCERGLSGFAPLRHRLEAVGERDGILLVDDSVCTTPEATAAAVSSYARPVVLLVGGHDKGLDWRPLIDAARRAREVVAYGETGPALARRISRAHLREGFDEAVRCALEVAGEGDVLLLSPGFSSYDQFPAFDERGDRFRELVGESG